MVSTLAMPLEPELFHGHAASFLKFCELLKGLNQQNRSISGTIDAYAAMTAADAADVVFCKVTQMEIS